MIQRGTRPCRWRRHRGGSRLAALAVLVALAALLAAVPNAAQAITIDDFSTNQAAQTLTWPPAASSASSVSGVGIQGAERDVKINLTGGVIAGNTLTAVVNGGLFSYSQAATIQGTGVVQWDGVDGSATLNPTGLGGLDLTAAGTQGAFSLGVFFDDLPVDLVLTVYTDAGNASALTTTLPGAVFASTSFVLPYSSFVTILGTGADFTNVGAITLSVGSNVTAPDLVIDFLQTIPAFYASKVAALVVDGNGNGLVDAGDTVEYTTVITNYGSTSATGVVFTSGAPTYTQLVVGSVTTSQGTVTTGNTAGDTSVAVNVGTVAGGGGTVTVKFRVQVDNPIPPGVTQIACQGLLTGTNVPSTPTDNPATPGPPDTTITPLNIPVVQVPTLDAWGFLALFTLLAGFGLRRLRRNPA